MNWYRSIELEDICIGLAVLVLSIALILAMSGCADHSKHPAAPLTIQVQGTVVPVVFYEGATVVTPSESRKNKLLKSAEKHLAAFIKDYGEVYVVVLEIYLDMDAAPSGLVNSGGTYLPSGRIMMISGKYDELPWLYHEFYHAKLHNMLGNAYAFDNIHREPAWRAVDEKCLEIAEELRRSE